MLVLSAFLALLERAISGVRAKGIRSLPGQIWGCQEAAAFKERQPGRLLEVAGAHLSLRPAATALRAPGVAAEFSLVPRAGGVRVSAATQQRRRREQRNRGAAGEHRRGEAQPAGLRAAGAASASGSARDVGAAAAGQEEA